MTDYQEPNLVANARRGDREAFELLVRRYEKKVLALTCRMCGSPEDGADAAQEAFLSAWMGLPAFRGDASFATWLYRLASNACVNHLRRTRHQAAESSLDGAAVPLDIPDSGPSPQDLAERAELREEIEAALQTLSPEHREILLLRETQQLSYAEIGQVLSLDAGTVKSRISRARGSLRKILRQGGNFSAAIPSKETGKEGWK